MDKLSIEEKAKRYDEAIEKLRDFYRDYDTVSCLIDVKEELANLIPELKESKDKRIKKVISDILLIDSDEIREILDANNVLMQDVDTWLEKQDEDKVKPKFKIGDWIVYNGNLYHIGNIALQRYYECLRVDGTVHTFGLDIDSKSHLWTIQDAKDGDVLSYRNGQWIFIYKEKVDDSSFDYHALYSTIHQDLTINDAGFTLLSDAIIPATKEQRDLLFQKMKEAGCEWDAEKKELKKIEQKPILDIEIPFGAKDSELEEVSYAIPKGYHAEIEDNKVVIKKGNKKSSWSEEDEEIISVLNAYAEVAENDDCPLNAEKIRKAICKLKSLRPQSQWRPSEEEIKALEFCLEHNIDKDGVFGSKVVKLYKKIKETYKITL